LKRNLGDGRTSDRKTGKHDLISQTYSTLKEKLFIKSKRSNRRKGIRQRVDLIFNIGFGRKRACGRPGKGAGFRIEV